MKSKNVSKMKINISLMKLTVRLLLLLIFFAIIYMILAVLYSSRYWPDVYRYINANITIKRIPTLSELELTILEVDGTTEFYSTVDGYAESSTVDGINIEIDDFTNFDDNNKEIPKTKRTKRYALEDFGKDYIELPKTNVVVDYLFLEETTTLHEDVIVTKIVKDLIDDSKLVAKNYGDVEIMTKLNEVDSDKLVSVLARLRKCVPITFYCYTSFS